MRNNLGQDLALLAEGGYGKITAYNEKEVADRLLILVNYHHDLSPLENTPTQFVLEMATAAIERDLPAVAERMNIRKLMEGVNGRDGQHFRDLFLSSLVHHIQSETVGLQPDEYFVNMLAAHQDNLKKP